jgi:hypothetical protein
LYIVVIVFVVSPVSSTAALLPDYSNNIHAKRRLLDRTYKPEKSSHENIELMHKNSNSTVHTNENDKMGY